MHKLIMVEIAPKSTMKVVPQNVTNVDIFMLYQGQHNYILNQQEMKPKWKTLSLVLNDTEVKIVAINANSNYATDKIAKTLKNFEELHNLIALKTNVIIILHSK